MNAWGAEEVAYTLTPATGSNNGYATNCDITINDITWNVTGNAQQIPWRLGGKATDSSTPLTTDRTIYSKTAIADNITSVVVTNGTASSITVNSFTLTVASDASFSNIISTVEGTFAASGTTTFTRPEGADWTGRYYKFTYNITISATSNKFLQFSGAVFNREATGAVVKPTITYTNKVSDGTFYPTSEVTLACATEGATIKYRVDITNGGVALEGLEREYSEPFNVSANTNVITAWAEKDGTKSDEATLTLTKATETTIAALKELSTTSGASVTGVLNNVIVTYAESNKAYIQDAEHGLYIYGANSLTAGKSVSLSFAGTMKTYNALVEFIPTTINVVSSTEATVPETEITIADLNENFAQYESMRMKIVEATTTAFSNKNATLTQGEATIAARAATTEITATNGATVTVVGYPGLFNTSKQFNVLTQDDIKVVTPATKETPTLTLGTYKNALTVGNSDEFTLTTNSNGTVTVVSSDETVATATYADGKVTISAVKAGTTTITVSTAETSTYYAASKNYTLTVSEPIVGLDYNAVVSAYDGKYYAMGYTVSNKALEAVEVNAVNGKVVNASNPDDLSWALTTAGEVVNKNGQYVSYSKADVSLVETTTTVFTEETDDNGFYWVSGTRGFLYRESAAGFKTYVTTSAGTSGYGTIGYLMPFVDGYVRDITLAEGQEVKYGTICLDRTIKAADLGGAKFYSIAGKRMNGEAVSSIVLEEETDGLLAGYPYIFAATANVVAAYTGAVEVTTAESNEGLVGSLAGCDVEAGMYLISNNKIVKAGTGCSIDTNRAYINMADVPVYTETAGAKVVELSLEGDATGINGVNAEANANDAFYNIAGQRVNASVKGLLIKNGKKYLNK